MDRYLFRGKQLGENQWVQGFLTKQRHLPSDPNFAPPYFLEYVIDHEENGVMLTSFIDPKTLGQCTGLKDKNGNLIFEGDIVKLETVSKHRSLGVVRWTEFARYEFWHIHQDEGFQLGQRFDETEIIGNIHDNPELLEVLTNAKID